MNLYGIQIKTGKEQSFKKLVGQKLSDNEVSILWPRRELVIRKKGIERKQEAPIFPGYVFLQSTGLDPDLYWKVKRTPGFVRFLYSGESLNPLKGDDLQLIQHFLSFGEVVKQSEVVFDKNNKIQILEGPLKGLEGQIIKVNKRKKRAKVKLQLYENSFTIDFSFKDMKKLPEKDKNQ
ncbi:MAG: antiterminator LoaP [Spirochaetia bacterium]